MSVLLATNTAPLESPLSPFRPICAYPTMLIISLFAAPAVSTAAVELVVTSVFASNTPLRYTNAPFIL